MIYFLQTILLHIYFNLNLLVLALAENPVGILIGKDNFCTEVPIRAPLNRKIWKAAAKWWNKVMIAP